LYIYEDHIVYMIQALGVQNVPYATMVS